jgi:peptidoglycan/xylan/chitin deacetylase (PgdA/CDA1 family)
MHHPLPTTAGPVPLGIMFHHFSSDRHPFIQGALSQRDFARVLRSIGPERFLRPQDWIDRSQKGTLAPRDLCLTFDDALLSQVEVALPVLDDFGLKAFFFVYSSIFDGHYELFEMIRYFRNVHFATQDAFHNAFYDRLRGTDAWPRSRS